jgi:hypothetical protein
MTIAARKYGITRFAGENVALRGSSAAVTPAMSVTHRR